MKNLLLTVLTLLSSVAFAQVDYLIRVRDPVFKSTITIEEKNIPQVKIKPGETIPYHLIKGQNILFVALTIDAPLDTTKSWIFNLSAVEDVVAPPPPADVTENVDDRDSRIVYGTGWDKTCCTTDANSPHLNKTMSWSCTSGNTFTFSFNGKSVTWFAEKFLTHGIAGVKFDNETTEAKIDLYNPTKLTQQAIFTKNFTVNGPHTVTVRVTGERNASATAGCIVSDYFRIIK